MRVALIMPIYWAEGLRMVKVGEKPDSDLTHIVEKITAFPASSSITRIR